MPDYAPPPPPESTLPSHFDDFELFGDDEGEIFPKPHGNRKDKRSAGSYGYATYTPTIKKGTRRHSLIPYTRRCLLTVPLEQLRRQWIMFLLLRLAMTMMKASTSTTLSSTCPSRALDLCTSRRTLERTARPLMRSANMLLYSSLFAFVSLIMLLS